MEYRVGRKNFALTVYMSYLKLAEEERDEPEKQITMGIPTLADLTEDDDAEQH